VHEVENAMQTIEKMKSPRNVFMSIPPGLNFSIYPL
jgi:hypothetical protein